MCEQTGTEPVPSKIPPEVIDFPYEVQQAMYLFNKLGDRIVGDVGYIGKDYTNLPLYLELYEIENKPIFIETLLRLDAHIIKKSQEEIKQKLKKKGS